MVGPSETTVLVFRVSPDGMREVGNAEPDEVFYCSCTQRVHLDDRDIHNEVICHELRSQRNHN